MVMGTKYTLMDQKEIQFEAKHCLQSGEEGLHFWSSLLDCEGNYQYFTMSCMLSYSLGVG